MAARAVAPQLGDGGFDRVPIPSVAAVAMAPLVIKMLLAAGADPTDMANSPVSRIEPFPGTIALLVKLGAKNNGQCKLVVKQLPASADMGGGDMAF